jgi:hypothetical protein
MMVGLRRPHDERDDIQTIKKSIDPAIAQQNRHQNT